MWILIRFGFEFDSNFELDLNWIRFGVDLNLI